MSGDLHITSLVVHALPARCAEVAAAVATLANAQVHGSDALGKLVVTLEAPTAGAILDQVGQIQQTPGVLGVAMVYQHAESLESLNAEISHEHTS
jgi:nitrate reductase NapD